MDISFLLLRLGRYDAEEIYYMANQEYTENLESLDVQTPAVEEWRCGVRTTGGEKSVQCWQSGMLYMIYLHHAAASLAGKRVCVARNRDLSSVENQVCKADTNNDTYGTNTESAYTWIYK